MKRTFLQVATLTLVGFAVVLQAGCGPRNELPPTKPVCFNKASCYVTNDSLVCAIAVQNAGPGDTTDVEKK
jgi:hypothetical protein